MGPVTHVTGFTAPLAHERIDLEDTALAYPPFRAGALGGGGTVCGFFVGGGGGGGGRPPALSCESKEWPHVQAAFRRRRLRHLPRRPRRAVRRPDVDAFRVAPPGRAARVVGLPPRP